MQELHCSVDQIGGIAKVGQVGLTESDGISIDSDRLKKMAEARAAQNILADLAQFEIDPHLSIYLAVDIRVVIVIRYTAGGKGGSDRAVHVVRQMDLEGFGNCSNHGECEAVCPKEISIENIAKMRREFMKAAFKQ